MSEYLNIFDNKIYCEKCGHKADDIEEYCEYCGNKVLRDLYEPVIAVPIDYSHILSFVPQGEDIIYSTIFKVVESDPGLNKKYEFNTQALMTARGIYYDMPAKVKTTTINKFLIERGLFDTFCPWHAVKLYTIGHWFDVGGLKCQLKREPNYETKESFKMRREQFYYRFAPIIIDAKNGQLEEFATISDPNKLQIKIRNKFVGEIGDLTKHIEKKRKKLKKKIEKVEGDKT